MRLLPDRARLRGRLALACAVLTASSACSTGFLRVDAPPDGVAVKAVTTDLAYGEVELPPPAATGPTQTSTEQIVSIISDMLLPFDEQFDNEPSGPLFRRRPPPPPLECDVADGDDFPEKVAGKLLQGPPTEGRYLWRQTGTTTMGSGSPVATPPLVRRSVRLITLTPSVVAYEYEIVRGAVTEIQTIEMRIGSTGQTGSNGSTTSIGTGTTARDGVFLIRLQWKGIDNFDFRPPAQLAPKLMSFPITSEHISAAALDPVSGIAVTFNGDVDANVRARLAGCNEAFDAWTFKGTRTIQRTSNPSAQAQSPTFDFYFAPQLGGLLVGDRTVTTSTLSAIRHSSDITSVLGSATPEPS